MIFLHPGFLFLIPLAAVFGFLVHLGQKRSREWKKEWGIPLSPLAFLHPWLLGGAFLILMVALARPVWDGQSLETHSEAQDTVFLVDVSRSMDTPDIAGNSRLDSVKLALLDLLGTLEGDRVALVAFAGTTVPKCPLTTDYAFFRQSLILLDTASTSRGGTLLGDALRNVQKNFSVPGRRLSVWVFTDGGDQESFPVEAASEYEKAGLSLYVWGVGTLSGGQVPEREVSSALNEELLASVAGAVPGGRYYGSNRPLWSLSAEYATSRKPVEISGTKNVVWKEGSWWLLWPTLFLVAFDSAIRLRSTKKRGRP